ncbi:MAG: hypothetical protein M3O34_19145, partial [Chloroflexota bacterium]|nr:hypothetical protein [Chloroflexota bacterium]
MSVARSPRQPAEIQNARNVLGLERRQECQDRAVVGGLAKYLANWRARVAQAGDAMTLDLAGRVVAALEGYAELTTAERAARLDEALTLLEHWPSPPASLPPRPVSLQGTAATSPPREGSVSHRATREAGQGDCADRSASLPLLARERMAGGEREAAAEGALRGEGTDPLAAVPPGARRRAAPPAAPPPETPIDEVKGIKAKEAGLFRRLGVATFRDLLFHYPSRYQAYPPAAPIADLLMQPIASVVGTVREIDISPTPRGGLHKIVAMVADRTGTLTATWFRHGRFSPVQPGQAVALSGKLTAYGRALNFENPDWERAEGEPIHTRRMVPTYPLTSGLTDRAVRERVRWAVDALADTVADPVPGSIREEHGLWPLSAALRQIHFPDDEGALQVARRRLAFDELFTIQLVVLQRKLQWQWAEAPALAGAEEPLAALLRAQPWQLTGGQRRALADVLADIAKPRPMIRLVQGEVGSGKTAVAAAALFVAVCNGAQG